MPALKLLIFILISLLISSVIFYAAVSITTSRSHKEIDVTIKPNKQASLAIFTQGQQFKFIDTKYYYASKDVYMKNETPGVIYIIRKETTWRDFFNTLPFKIDFQCLVITDKESYCDYSGTKLHFYLNGKLETDVFSKEISDKDKLLVTFGYVDAVTLKNQLEKIPD